MSKELVITGVSVLERAKLKTLLLLNCSRKLKSVNEPFHDDRIEDYK